jgi:hypothetical protein
MAGCIQPRAHSRFSGAAHQADSIADRHALDSRLVARTVLWPRTVRTNGISQGGLVVSRSS